MPTLGMNLATTADGAGYNKLRRPDDFLASMTANPPPRTNTPKRKLEETNDAGSDTSEEHESKRKRSDNLSGTHESPKILIDHHGGRSRKRMPVGDWGMQSMFPEANGNASDEEDLSEVLAYLNGVRSEASAIPQVLVAPPPELDEENFNASTYTYGRGDYRAVYNDGTWISVSQDNAMSYEEDWGDDSFDLDPQDGYYISLISRYKGLRAKLEELDWQKFSDQRDADTEPSQSIESPNNRRTWRHALERVYPTPALVARITEDNLYRGLEYCALTLDRRDFITKQKACWIWTLLALAGDAGTLDFWKVGRIRDLGHKAGQLSIRLRGGSIRRPLENESRDEDSDDDVESCNKESEGIKQELDTDSNCKIDEVTSSDVANSELGVEQQCNAQENIIQTQQGQHLLNQDNKSKTTAHPNDNLDHGQAPNNDSGSELGTDMSISSDDNDTRTRQEEKPATIEEARQRLLAQLGDRLVSPRVPSKSESRIPRSGGHHRHHGKLCQDDACYERRRRNQLHRETGQSKNQTQQSKSNITQQKLQLGADKKLSKSVEKQPRGRGAGNVNGLDYDADDLPTQQSAPKTSTLQTEPSKGMERKVFSSRVEAEEYRRSLLEGESTAQKADGVVPEQSQVPSMESNEDSEPKPDLNTKATIDMILTVVAECFGQRDLLRYREVWD